MKNFPLSRHQPQAGRRGMLGLGSSATAGSIQLFNSRKSRNKSRDLGAFWGFHRIGANRNEEATSARQPTITSRRRLRAASPAAGKPAPRIDQRWRTSG